jgi:putative FmdB family regulatory protein
MPTYDYQCKVCSLRFELKKGFDESVEDNCPQCCGEARRLFSPVPIVFKGPGFYVTDNAAQNSAAKLDDKRDGDKPSESEKAPEPPKDKKNEVVV